MPAGTKSPNVSNRANVDSELDSNEKNRINSQNPSDLNAMDSNKMPYAWFFGGGRLGQIWCRHQYLKGLLPIIFMAWFIGLPAWAQITLIVAAILLHAHESDRA